MVCYWLAFSRYMGGRRHVPRDFTSNICVAAFQPGLEKPMFFKQKNRFLGLFRF